MFEAGQWQQLLDGFLEEASELLKQAEDSLLVLERDPGQHDAIHALFRAIHTLKGSAGIFSLDPLVALAHQMENLLMQVRDGERSLDGQLTSLLLQCMDMLTVMVHSIDPRSAQLAEPAGQAELLAALALVSHEPVAIAQPASSDSAPPETDGQLVRWHLSLRFDSELLRNGFEPSTFLRYLSRLGHVELLNTLDWAVPALEKLDPEQCYLGFEIILLSNATRETLQDVFSLADDFCTLRLACETQLDEPPAAPAPTVQPEPVEPPQAAEPSAPAATAAAPAENRPTLAAPSATIKVAAHKLDELINLVGELVISAAGAQMRAMRTGDSDCIERVQAVHEHVEQIRERALKLRMVEIGETFSRFHRVVRDVSLALDKKIQLHIRGGDTELDKTLIDRIADPLVHLVRNAIDHGIESPEQRLLAGKPAQGNLHLVAYHDSGMIVLEIDDDGRGLDTARIRAKAIDRGMLDPEANLPDRDIHRLIFEAGFSTAEQVSNLSGRGVGMDVVRSAIEALRGVIEIDSRPGQGCTFRIRLPLTLAIIDGFLVRAATEHFVIPLDMVIECMEAPAVLDGHLNLRGEPLPCIDLSRHFALGASDAKRRSIVVVSQGRQRIGLVVDHLVGELQTVIKPLGQMFQHLNGISGSTILGSGQVALILDIPSLFRERLARDEHPRPVNPATPILSGEY